MDNFKNLVKHNVKEYSMVIALVVIAAFFQIITDGTLLKPLNITNLILQNSYILILAIGMLLVIVAFHIDLSVGSTAALIGAISAMLMVKMHTSVFVGVGVSLLVGALIGAFQGFWIAYVKIPAFIVTLAGMLIFRGLTMVGLGGTSLAPYPVAFQKISSGFIPDFFHGKDMHITTLLIGIIFSVIYVLFELRKRNNQKKLGLEVSSQYTFIAKTAAIVIVANLFTYNLASYKGLPNVLVLLAVLIAFYTFITTKTVIGRHIYALGGNEKAAKLSGVKTQSLVFWVFVNMGVMAALSGIVFAARLNAATPKAGTGFELDAIAACFIGGASASGGVGKVMGAIIGGLVMGIMNNGMSLIGLGIDWQQAIKGVVLLLAVAFDVYTKSKSS
ncbi:multiple monosaccharide ABC transporter permease [Clostridium magnum]|uniref:Xylose transport system permease protein XylH n=1 Tax=Clostridium magnum DSM 2767 TaxID=1121326 RepID=A0A161X9T8_9CLOT|nr:multiple monosaccharide ABC transporter permease [Clostridium magnum]KZL90996.1 xylose transport system permease protein XylH [Clostridium magnum DSM 2767]SHI66354.1 multiple monosaccharide ABC transporter membrane protein [Clostridium magnum DSM 2767]